MNKPTSHYQQWCSRQGLLCVMGLASMVTIVDTIRDNVIGLNISAKGDMTSECWLQLTTVNVR